MENKKYYQHLDILRVLACVAVILLHTNARYVEQDFNSLNFIFGNFFVGISRIAVPTFLMISGSLLLDEGYNNTNEKDKKRIVKMLKFLVFWSVFYSLVYNVAIPLFKGRDVDIIYTIEMIIKGHYHLWFVYMMIGIYLILPLLRLWIKKENIKYVKYYLILSFVFGFVLPQIIEVGLLFTDFFAHLQHVLTIANMSHVGGFVFYFVLGWYLNNTEFKNNKIFYLAGMMALIFSIIFSIMLSLYFNRKVSIYGNMTMNVVMFNIGFYLYVKNMDLKLQKKPKLKWIIDLISEHSLGIYAVHALINTIVIRIVTKVVGNFSLINVPICLIMVLVISLIITIIIKKIPVLKQFV